MKEKSKDKRRDRLLRTPFSVADGLLAVGMIVLAAVLIIQPWGVKASGRAQEIIVEVNGKEIMRLPLVEETRDYEAEGYTGTSYFQLEGYEVRMVDSACPDKLCVHEGLIGESGNSIVCLPNRVVLRLVGAGGTDTVQR
jgi:hypothetical protein